MIDLHSHSTRSDGTLTPRELILKAAEIPLNAIALTDHDTLDGLKEAEETASECQIRFIPGIELEIEHYPGELHLLGLGIFNWEDSTLDNTLNTLRTYRNDRNSEMIRLIQNDGISITHQDLQNTAGGRIIARPHFARLLVERKVAKNMRHAFDKFLGTDQKYYVPKKVMQLEDGIRLIKSAGGHPVIAHPLSLYLSWGKLPGRLSEWKEAGIEGIEAWHSGANANQAKRMEKLADELGLYVTGGSDFHGENRKDRKLGRGGGKKPVPDHFMDFLL
jgi:predicted metal-dependent phosphoesterase TrpH